MDSQSSPAAMAAGLDQWKSQRISFQRNISVIKLAVIIFIPGQGQQAAIDCAGG